MEAVKAQRAAANDGTTNARTAEEQPAPDKATSAAGLPAEQQAATADEHKVPTATEQPPALIAAPPESGTSLPEAPPQLIEAPP
mmetsp:Transcript_110240/g.219025  ORF Transcript_110240/g.219025 Transcript_110240/m.219025 type:complete len:84 (+) Transcript_110240:254-505(+)